MKLVQAALIGVSTFSTVCDAEAGRARAYAKLERIPNPAGEDDPQCVPEVSAKTWGDRLKDSAVDAVGKAVSVIPGAGDDPFNTKRTNQSFCRDLCVVVPSGADFTAMGSVTGTNRSGPEQGELPNELTGSVHWSWAGVAGPGVEATPKGDVVCYTFKNWSHTYERSVSLIVRYPDEGVRGR